MNGVRKVAGKKVGRLLAVVWVVVALVGCQTMSAGYSGKAVPPSKQVSLAKSGEHSGEYNTEDLEITYRYIRNGNTLNISGNICFADRLKNSFSRIASFHADVLFVNGEGRVTETQGLTTSSMSTSDYPLSFSRSLVIPADSAALSFSYSGTAKSDDRHQGPGGDMVFSDFPGR